MNKALIPFRNDPNKESEVRLLLKCNMIFIF